MDNNIYKAVEMYTNNIDMDSIIEATGLQEIEIRVKLKEMFLDRKNTKVINSEVFDRIEILYNREYSIPKIADTLLISQTCVRRFIRTHELPPHTVNHANYLYDRDHNYFDNIDTPNKAYILGLLFADGCNYVDHNAIHLHLQEEDVDILTKIRDEIHYQGPLRFNPRHEKNNNHKNVWELVINDKHMSEALVEKGMVQAKSLIVTFPTCVPNNLLRHFVRGYFDGDGCLWFDEKRNKCQTQTCGTRDVCGRIKELMEILGCDCFITHPSYCKDNTVLVRTAANKSSYKFLSWMYDDLRAEDIRMERKYQKYLEFKERYNYKGNTKSSIA